MTIQGRHKALTAPCVSACLAVVVGFAILPACAQQRPPTGPSPDDLGPGYKFAIDTCSDCHDVSQQGGVSANRFAPRFLDVANQASTTELSLRVFLQSPHRRMPNLILTEQQRDDVIAYILSLRRKAGR